MAKKLVKRKIEDLLLERGELDITQIRDHINENTSHGTDKSELGNILSRYDHFIKVRTEKRKSGSGHSSYDITVWKLSDEYRAAHSDS